ncbi:MAG: bile acid:sodium symporter family protein [Anderseniella sp.]
MQTDDEKTLASLLLALGVVLALYVPELSPYFAPYLLPSLFLVMVFSLLPFARIRADKLLHLHPMVISLILWQQFLLPIGVILIGRQIGLDSQLIFFIVLTLTSGSLFASPTLVQLMGLDQRIAVQTVVLSTLAAPVFIYLFFSFLHTGPIDLNLFKFGERLFWFLLIPICIFVLVRKLIGNWPEASKDQVDRVGRWGSVLSLIVFCFALEDEVNMHIAANVQDVINYLFIGIVTAACVAVLTRAVMSRFGQRAAATATVLASFRNVGLTFGLVGSIAGPEVAVYVGVVQIPMFCAPLFFDLFIGRSKYAHPPDNGPEPSKPMPGSIPDRPVSEKSQSQQQLNSIVTNLQQTASERETPAMIKITARSRESARLAYEGSAAVAVSAETQSQTASNPAVSDPDPGSETQTMQDLKKRMEDARAVLARLEAEMREASGKIVRRPGRYLAVFALFATLGLATIWQSNKYFYPMLFNDGMLVEVAEAHTQKRNYGVFDLNINIRDLRNETIKRMAVTPDLVVLGASHWQEAHTDLLPQYNFYNSHVHRDYYEDMMAVTEMWVRHDKLPKQMIITIRDNLFTPVSERNDFLWYPGIKYYREFATRIGFEPHAWWQTLPYQTWRELVSLPLLWSQAKHQLQSDVMPHATDERNFDGLDTLLPGGSILWSGEHQRLFTAERARDEALKFAKARRNDPPKVDPKGLVHMEALFEFLKEQGVKVTLAHPQFNPVFWEAVQGSPYMDGLRKIERITQDWSAKYGFAVMGGFSPDSVGCRAKQYIDAEHGDPACLGALLAQYDVVNNKALPGTTIVASKSKTH